MEQAINRQTISIVLFTPPGVTHSHAIALTPFNTESSVFTRLKIQARDSHGAAHAAGQAGSPEEEVAVLLFGELEGHDARAWPLQLEVQIYAHDD